MSSWRSVSGSLILQRYLSSSLHFLSLLHVPNVGHCRQRTAARSWGRASFLHSARSQELESVSLCVCNSDSESPNQGANHNNQQQRLQNQIFLLRQTKEWKCVRKQLIHLPHPPHSDEANVPGPCEQGHPVRAKTRPELYTSVLNRPSVV